MPLFYLRPFDFHADKRQRIKIIDFNVGEMVLYFAIGVVALALFVVFVVFPALTVLAETTP
jgi:hypothetical protein